MTLDSLDPTFSQDLRDSRCYVELAAQWLRERGYKTKVVPVKVRPEEDSWWEYGADHDILVEEGPVEVKHRSVRFHGVQDYPYRTVIVDVVHAWERAKEKPLMYIIFNQDASGMLVVHGDTRGRWKATERWDRHAGRKRAFFECPKELARYYSLD